MAKCKRMEEGGLSFAEMKDEDRASAAKAAMADIEERSMRQRALYEAENAEKMMADEPKPVKRAAPKVSVAKTESKPTPKEVKAEAPRSERAPSSAKAEPITGPKPAKSAEAAMPDVKARKAATEARQRRSVFGGENKGVYGMKSGGSVSSASRRGDGCAVRGKTKGRMV